LRSGRPRQLSWQQLREQVRRREQAGQKTREYEAALAERAANPVQLNPRGAGGRRADHAAPAARGAGSRSQAAVALGLGLSMVLVGRLGDRACHFDLRGARAPGSRRPSGDGERRDRGVRVLQGVTKGFLHKSLVDLGARFWVERDAVAKE